VASLDTGLPPRLRGRRLLLVLQAFIDDGGDTDRFLMAGYVAPIRNWEQFSGEWQKVLEESPRISIFKVKNYRHLSEMRFHRFISAINHHVSFAVSCAISLKGYENEMKGFLAPRVDNPYFWCFYEIVVSVLAHMKKSGINDQVDFVFDENTIYADRVMEGYRHFRHAMTNLELNLIGSPPIFRNDARFLPIQAADMFAWLSNRKLAKRKYPKVLDELRMLPTPDVWTAERLAIYRENSERALHLIKSEKGRDRGRMLSIRKMMTKT
jgi:hypothetical protein